MTTAQKEMLEFIHLVDEVVRDLTQQQATRYGLLLADWIVATCLDICTDKTHAKCLLVKEGIDLAWNEFLDRNQVPQQAEVLCRQGVPSWDEEEDGLILALVGTSTNGIADFIEATLERHAQYSSYLSSCIVDLFVVVRDEDVVDNEQLDALLSCAMSQQLSILGQIEGGTEIPRDPHPTSFLGSLLSDLKAKKQG